MALFHLESKIHSKKTKSGGSKSISSIVAYRHCFAMGDFDYSNKSGFIDSFMMFPEEVINKFLENENLPGWFDNNPVEFEKFKEKVKAGDSISFWQSVEAKEKRKDAQLCEELIISLQHELSLEENIKNLKTLINKNYISKGRAADICIHNSGDNLHAHVLLTQRPLEGMTFTYIKPLEEIGFKGEIELGYEFGNKIRDQHFSKYGKMDQITPWIMDTNICRSPFAYVILIDECDFGNIFDKNDGYQKYNHDKDVGNFKSQ